MNDVIATALVVIGVACLIARGKRRFERINKYGVERFRSFVARLRGRTGDRVLAGLGMVLMAAGTIAMANNHIDSWGWIVMLPVSVIMLYLLLGT